MRVRNETIYNEKKARIMEACFNCYAENGLHGTGLSALAKAAGISKAAIYTYFEDADALIIESTEYCMSKVEDEFMKKAPTDPQDVKRFLEEGEKSLYQEGEDAGKQLTKEMESFVSDYNMMIRKIGDLSDSVDETYAKKLKTEISARETALKQIGITQEKDGTLSFDKTVFQTVKPEAVQKIFGDKSTLSNRVQVLASGVKSNCRKQAAALSATSYTTSGNYSRYASYSNQTRQTGSRYNAKG